MNWEIAAAAAQVVGAVGVIASLVYLSFQIRANTRATRASAMFDATHSWAQFNESVGALPDATFEIVVRALKTEARVEDFAPLEWGRLQVIHRASLWKLEGQYYLFKYGLLEPDLWEKRRRITRMLLTPPVMHAWWDNEVRAGSFTDEFVTAIETAPVIDHNINRQPSDGSHRSP